MDLPTSKQPSEEYYIEADYSRVWVTGESVTLASSTITAVNKADEDKTADVLDVSTHAVAPSGKGVVVRIRAGLVAESPYIITSKIKTSGGQRWELDMEMVIFDE